MASIVLVKRACSWDTEFCSAWEKRQMITIETKGQDKPSTLLVVHDPPYCVTQRDHPA